MATPNEPRNPGIAPEQLDDLVHKLSGGTKEIPTPPQSVKPYRFGNDNLSVLGNYQGLRMINERFCRRARSSFLPFLRIQPRVTAAPPEVKSFQHFCEDLDNFVSLTTARVDELRSSSLTVLRPSFVSLLTNAYYGGDVIYPSSDRAEFTASEHRVIDLCTNELHRALSTAWADVFRLTFSRKVHEDNLQFATFAESDEQVVCCSFDVHMPDVPSAKFDVVYPVQALKPIASKLRSGMQIDHATENLRWRKRLEAAVMSVPLTVTARLATPEVALKQLLEITPGCVVPVNLKLNPQLLVEGKPYFHVEPGDQSGRAAVSLVRRCEDASQKEEDL
ncbi:MAG: flagellar motor switch protein FliM [Pseudomonadota bacterium]